MACPSSITSSKFVLLFFTLILISCSLKRGNALEETTAAESNFHSVQISSILPSLTCKPSPSTGSSGKSALKIVDSNGPCHEGKSSKLTLAQILSRDQSRVTSIQARHASSLNIDTNSIGDSKTKIPDGTGFSLGTGDYVVTVGLGTPEKNYTLVFDTGSDLTWTQCQPCVKFCYPQNDPIYNPLKSSTYSNLSCASKECDMFYSGTGHAPVCSGSTCEYGIQYGDGSFTVGFLAKETLTLGFDALPDFLFGCGQDNQGLYGTTDGVLGLSRGSISLVSRTGRNYGEVFSYCLPTSSSSNGYLSFGKGSYSKGVKFTPFPKHPPNNIFYFVDIVGIKVAGRLLPINATVFQKAGTVVDSGTVITRLPPAAYSVLRNAFREKMKKYEPAPAVAILDTCYNFTGLTTINVPKISFIFSGKAKVDLGINGILMAASTTQICLAFAGNIATTDVGIFGNIQQQTLEVVYDVAGGRLGFKAGGCS